MSLEFTLSQKLSQNLKITPQLKQAIKMLTLNNIDLNTEIREYLDSNPILEIQEDAEVIVSDESVDNQYDFNWEPGSHSAEDKDYLFDIYSKEQTNIFDELTKQSSYINMSKKNKVIFVNLIGNINQKGFLTETIENIAQIVNCSENEVLNVLDALQSLEPTGIGSKDIQEFLLIQLENMGKSDSLCFKVIKNCFDTLAKQNLKKISKELDCAMDDVYKAAELIKSLRHSPLSGYDISPTKYMVPDLFLIENKNSWEVTINEEILPKISISQHYLTLINNNTFDSEAEKKYLLKNYKDAGWFLKAIYQRSNTLKRVGEAVFNHQSDFIYKGANSIKPLTLKTIANEIDMHESTVSRAVNSKFIETPRGTFPLKFFFSNKTSAQKNSSGVSVKNIIKELIASENTQKPLSDQQISENLLKHGIKIARRTISKYREELNIPSTKIRRQH